MSLILDALRKSDRQRNRQASEQLRWGPGPATSAQPAHSPWLIALSLLLLLALVIAGAWLGTRLAAPPDVEKPAKPAAEPAVQERDRQPTRPASKASDTERNQVRALSGELLVQEAAPSTKAGGDETAPASEEVLLAPSLAAMPESFRADLPELAINVHAWAESPRDRFVLINMRRYAEGEQLREGPTLLQVTPDGAVLEYRNERFTLTQR